MFVEKTEVYYNGQYGKIKFICPQYVVVTLKNSEGRQPPHVLVFPPDYDKIVPKKDSQR